MNLETKVCNTCLCSTFSTNITYTRTTNYYDTHFYLLLLTETKCKSQIYSCMTKFIVVIMDRLFV